MNQPATNYVFNLSKLQIRGVADIIWEQFRKIAYDVLFVDIRYNLYKSAYGKFAYIFLSYGKCYKAVQLPYMVHN